MSEQAVMKHQVGKLIIGLTGNIATGKSVVSRLATENGALTIDADRIVHEIMDGNPDTQAAIAVAFGSRVRREDGRIDRRVLGKIVFSDPGALRDLEAMLHPLVRQEVYRRVDATEAKIIVIEAIKLLEGDLVDACHQIWVTRCAPKRQLERLLICRGLDAETAKERINAQPPQEEKVALADVVIETDGLMTETEAQVNLFWSRLPDPTSVEPKAIPVMPEDAPEEKPAVKPAAPPEAKPSLDRLAGAKEKLQAKREKERAARRQTQQDDVPAEAAQTAAETETPSGTAAIPTTAASTTSDAPLEIVAPEARPDNLEVRRARPSDIPSILLLIHKATDGTVKMKRSDLLLALSERSYFIGQVGTEISTIIGWNIENLVSKMDQIFIHPMASAGLTGPAVLEEIEKSADQHICEVLVVFISQESPPQIRQLYEAQGYQPAELEKMPGSWRRTIGESQPENSYFLIKVLRERESHPMA